MKQFNREKGNKGENFALDFLLGKGYKHQFSNYLNNFGEIDLIMTDKNTLVFVEVKLKIGDIYGSPEEMINKNKLLRVRRTAEMFLYTHEIIRKKYKKYRIDAVCIIADSNMAPMKISHYINIDE